MIFTHIYPLNDLKDHLIEDGDKCWCNPEKDGDLIVHHSMDGREDYETGKRRPN